MSVNTHSNSAAFEKAISAIKSDDDFNLLALEIFHYQSQHNPVYRDFLSVLKTDIRAVRHYTRIPCLPISFFKTHQLYCGNKKPETIYLSSATGGQTQSRHFVSSEQFYLQHAQQIFESFYGSLNEWVILALLPGYMERTGSSLIAMLNHFMRFSDHRSGFFLHETEELYSILTQLRKENKKVLLWGVTFALIEFAQKYPDNYSHVTIMETGGMKGRGKEMVREELHQFLQQHFQVKSIHSEYGMTEMMSQAYSKGEGKFSLPLALKIQIRNTTDPFDLLPAGRSGAINIYDLANYQSLSFIASDDLGKIDQNQQLEILGRLDNSDIRGCNLLVI